MSYTANITATTADVMLTPDGTYNTSPEYVQVQNVLPGGAVWDNGQVSAWAILGAGGAWAIALSGLVDATEYTVTVMHVWPSDPIPGRQVEETLTFTTGDPVVPTVPPDVDPPADPPGVTDPNPPGTPLTPEVSRPVGTANCYRGGRRGFEVRAYRLAGGAWRRVAFPTLKVTDCSFTHRRDGGMAQADVAAVLPMEEEPALQPGDRISVWVREASGWVEWWRGYYQAGDRDTGRPDTWRLTAYGAIERFAGVYVDRQYAMASEDLSVLFAALVTDYVDPYWAALGFPALARDIQAVGVTVGETARFRSSLNDVFTSLVRSVPGVTWGVDLDDAGRERIYLRPRPTTSKYVVSYGHDCNAFSIGLDASEVVNAVTMEGGPALYPNLIPNGGFERPVSEGANLILNPSFEDVQKDNQKRAVLWTRIKGDPSVKGPDTADTEPLSPASGERFLEMDNYGDHSYKVEAIQSAPVQVTGGTEYTFRVHLAVETSTAPNRPIILLKVWGAGDTPLPDVEITRPGGLNDWRVDSQSWQLREHTFTMPALAVMAAVYIETPEGSRGRGLGVDDVTLFSAHDISQENWHVAVNDTSTGWPASLVNPVWNSRDCSQGAYAVAFRYETGENARCYAGIETEDIAVTEDVELRLSFDAKAGAAPADQALDVILWAYNGSEWKGASAPAGDGDLRASTYTTCRRITLPAGGDWTRYHIDFQTPADCQKVRLMFGGVGLMAGSVAVDAAYMHVGWPANADGTPLLSPFVEGQARVVYRLSTEDAWFQSGSDPIGKFATQDARNSAIWHTGDRAGSVHHGTREKAVSVPTVRTVSDARRWAVNHFNQHAVERYPSPVSLVDRLRNYRADGLMRLVNAPQQRGANRSTTWEGI